MPSFACLIRSRLEARPLGELAHKKCRIQRSLEVFRLSAEDCFVRLESMIAANDYEIGVLA